MDKERIKYLMLISGTIVTVFLLSLIARKILNFFIRRDSKKLRVDPTNFIFLKKFHQFYSVLYRAFLDFL